jgi:hypothetical protein
MRIIRSRTARAAGRALIALILGALLVPAGALARPHAAAKHKKSNPSLWNLKGTAPQPGPAALYQPLASAPQLENAPGSPWKAQPLLVSGASAYRMGEFLYQGYVYDDHGAKLTVDPNNPMTTGGGGDLFSAPDGTYAYPSGPGYDENAANLIELRVKRLKKATAFRITLNTLENPNLVATAIAIGGSEGQSRPFPFGANVNAPAQYFLTIHGETAVLTDAVTGATVPGPAPSVSVDVPRRQITVTVSNKTWNPGAGKVRLAAGVGLWDTAANRYLLPGKESNAKQPGGAGETANPAAFFDVGFRFNSQEPMTGTPEKETTANPRWWREAAQSQALAANDISQFHVEVDFSKLTGRTTIEEPDAPTGVPTTGAFDRIYASHFTDGQGANYLTACAKADVCIGEMRGQLLPYAIYVPKVMPAGGYGLTLLLHSLSANYNQYLNSRNQSQFANRPNGSIVITPTGRGPDGWYYDRAGADVFEAWADAASRYALNPAYTDIAGYSMGGYGTYKFASEFPDLFAKAQPTVGPPALGIWDGVSEPTGGESTLTKRMLESVRNIPFLIWNQTSDELVPIAGVKVQVKRFDELGYRYEFDEFHGGDHLALAINDEFGPAAAFLGSDTVQPNPAHVTYTYNPTMDFPADGTTAGHAYWVYGVTLRDSSGKAPIGTIDVRSERYGVGDPPPSATKHETARVMTGGAVGAQPFDSDTKTWGATPATPVANTLDINATNIAAVTIEADRAKVNCHPHLNIKSDGPIAVTIANCH